MKKTWPEILKEARAVTWESLAPKYQTLINEPLAESNLDVWLSAWSDLEKAYLETYMSLMRAKDENSLNEDAEAALLRYCHACCN